MYMEFNKRGKHIHSSSYSTYRVAHIMKSKENVFNNLDTEWLKGGSARLSTKCLDRII